MAVSEFRSQFFYASGIFYFTFRQPGILSNHRTLRYAKPQVAHMLPPVSLVFGLKAEETVASVSGSLPPNFPNFVNFRFRSNRSALAPPSYVPSLLFSLASRRNFNYFFLLSICYCAVSEQPEKSKTERGNEGPGLALSAVFLLERDDLGTSLLLCPGKMVSQGN